MKEGNAARYFKAIKKAQIDQIRQTATDQPEVFIQLAIARGYRFSLENLHAEISRLSDEEIAAIFNPGIGPRRHLGSHVQ